MPRLATVAAALTLVLALASPAAAQTVVLRVEFAAPSGGGTPQATVQPYEQGTLAERAALREMASSLEYHLRPAVRDCQAALAFEIDAGSFRGHLVSGTADGLHPGTRARFQSLARALSAVCRRGDLERGAVQSSIRTIRFGRTDSAQDGIALDGGVLTYRTNGDLSGRGHMDYAPFITWLTEHL